MAESARPYHQERIPLAGVQVRLQALGAQYYGPPYSDPAHKKYLYLAHGVGAWVSVQLGDAFADLAYYSTCPCGR